MLNLMIIDDNINNSIFFLNSISKNCHQVKVFSVAMTLKEGIKNLNTGVIDIILIHVNECFCVIEDFLNSVSDLDAKKYKNSIILITDFSNDHNNRKHPYIYECISDDKAISVIISAIKEIARIKYVGFNNNTLLSKINNELVFLGYNLSYVGTKYLAECIALIYNNQNINENLKQFIYPVLAKQHGKTVNNIKSNILVATNLMFYECDENRLKKYFNFYTVTKPTPKLVIYTVLNNL